jgi:Xaa-Pro aminopeptidase
VTPGPPGGHELPPIGYPGRVAALREAAVDRGVDGVLVTNPVNVRWVSGFTGSAATVVITPTRAVLVTDGRYRERALDELAAVEVDVEVQAGFSQADQLELVRSVAAESTSLGAEAATLSHQRWERLAAELPIVPLDDVINHGRRRKDAGEIARIEAACRYADAALAEVAPMLGDHLTESDVRTELEYRMRLHGADGPSYATIVASGPSHAARPHHDPSDRTIVEGDTVVIDVGALVDGYHSDMTRSFVIGQPTAEQADLYALLLAIQAAGISAVAADVPAAAVDEACRSMARDAGYDSWFLHSTGHGVGLQIHEDPFESPVSTQTLVAGDVVTVEPGLYRVGFGGFRIEDLLEVGDGGGRVLTASPKDTPCLPSRPTT